MDIFEAMKTRHSVRQYLERPIDGRTVKALEDAIRDINGRSGMHFQLATDEPTAFSGPLAHYGSFRGCTDYFMLAGPEKAVEEAGYYGEELVLTAQMLGLNTCWVALTYSKSKVRPVLAPGEKLHIVIALGYGAVQGVPHKNKPMEKLCRVNGTMPEWFRRGMEAAMLAPTAINQQQFVLTLRDDGRVSARALPGPCSKMDLGIVKYHFEVGAGKDSFAWV